MINASMPEDRIVRENLSAFVKSCEKTREEDADLQEVYGKLAGMEDEDREPYVFESKKAHSPDCRCLNFLDIPLVHGTVNVR